MKISYNWIQEYLDFQLPAAADLVEKIGAQLGQVETVTDLGAKYQKILIAKVVSCEPVISSDHLNACLIDDGGVILDIERNQDGLVQVVCGAPNVRAGLTVAWLPPGSTVPSSFDKAPFVLGVRNLCGMVSNGMLASPQELVIGDSHDGILELDEQKPGTSFAEAYGLNDYIIDIENKMFTHRPDCFGILGVAREIAGILGHQFVEPNWYAIFTKNLLPLGEQLPLMVHNLAPQLVPRFMALVLSGLTVQPSSVKQQTYLSRVGIRPINNIVDATNYFMYLTGQPLHAYDYDKVKALDGQNAATLVARQSQANESLSLLSGKVIEPRDGAIVIATNTQTIGLAGVMGGASTEVDGSTKNIILESATFDMYSIRRTSMIHGLFSEAVTRFNKGQSPYQNDRVLLAAAHHLCDTAGAQFASDIFDEVSPQLSEQSPASTIVEITPEFISSRLGMTFEADQITKLLVNVGFVVELAQNSQLVAELRIGVPFWRTDIQLKEDIVEEVGRLHGFDNLPFQLPLRTLLPAGANPILTLKQQLRSGLKSGGANEVLTYSFVHGDLFAKVGQDKLRAYRLKNALSPDLQFYRLSLTPSLLEKVHTNVRAGYAAFALFEFGKTHQISSPIGAAGSGLTEEGVPLEPEHLSLIFTADAKAAKQYGGAAFYQGRLYALLIFKILQLDQTVRFVVLAEDEPANQATTYYAAGRAAAIVIGDVVIGYVGEYRSAVLKALKLPAFTAGLELDTDSLLAASLKTNQSYEPLPKFPKIEQDICLRLPTAVLYEQLVAVVEAILQPLAAQSILTALALVDIYQSSDQTNFKQITLRISLANYARTMTEVEVSKILETISVAAQTQLQAERV